MENPHPCHTTSTPSTLRTRVPGTNKGLARPLGRNQSVTDAAATVRGHMVVKATGTNYFRDRHNPRHPFITAFSKTNYFTQRLLCPHIVTYRIKVSIRVHLESQVFKSLYNQ